MKINHLVDLIDTPGGVYLQILPRVCSILVHKIGATPRAAVSLILSISIPLFFIFFSGNFPIDIVFPIC